MLAFRSESHVDHWCAGHGIARGASFPLATAWRLAQAWYPGRLDAGWRKRTPEEAQAVLDGVGLTGSFWRLG